MKRSHHYTVYSLQYHLVLVTKYRRKCLNEKIRASLKEKFLHLCQKWEIDLKEFGGEDDHVHLLIHYPPKVSISSLVNSLKGVSSRMIRQKEYPTIKQKLWGNALWAPSYFAGSCGGASIDIVRQYIEQQKTPH